MKRKDAKGHKGATALVMMRKRYPKDIAAAEALVKAVEERRKWFARDTIPYIRLTEALGPLKELVRDEKRGWVDR